MHFLRRFMIFSTILLFSLVLFFISGATTVSAATGDIIAIRASSTPAYGGWAAEIDIAGLSTGGTYNFGNGTNNNMSAATLSFTVTSPGYDDAGNRVTTTRTVYATNYVRRPYPNDATAYEYNKGGFVTVTVALSDYIFAGDTVVANVSSGFYTQASTPNNASTTAFVYNNSTETVPTVIANWSYPGYSLVQSSTLRLRATAFHRSARNGRPVRLTVFSCSDTSGHTAYATTTDTVIDSTLTDAVPIVEYVGDVPMASLTNGNTLTCNFKAYPWYGTVFDTGDGMNIMPTPLYAPQTYILDKSSTYGVTDAVVSPTGNDGTGAVVDSASFNPASPPNAYATIAAAANGIAAYNNTHHSRNNTAGGIIYLKAGSYVFTGGSETAGALANTPVWVTLTKFPGETTDNVIFSTASDDKQIGTRLKIQSIKITNSTTIGVTNETAIWVDDCTLNTTGLATFYENVVNYFTDSRFANGDELTQFSTVLAARALVRGNSSTATLTVGMNNAYTVIGNRFSLTDSANFQTFYEGQTTPSSTAIVGFNIFSHSNPSLPIFGQLNDAQPNATGTVVVQNIFEQWGTTAGPDLQIAADGSSAIAHNIMIWNNVVVGQRVNFGYNDFNLNNQPLITRKYWSIRNNVFDDTNFVTDIDAHAGSPNGSRYGNHSLVHGAGLSGNVELNRVGTNSFGPKFPGLYSAGFTGVSTTPYYVNDQSSGYGGTGNGNYHPTASSPFINLLPYTDNVINYDLAGVARNTSGLSASGAYEYGSATVSGTLHTIVRLLGGGKLLRIIGAKLRIR